MFSSSQNLKEKMLELTRLFSIERNIFQKFVIVYKYIGLLNTDPLTRGILQKMFDDTAKIMGRFDNESLDEEEFLNVKGEAIYSNDFWVYYSNLEVIYGKMKKIKNCQLDEKADFENLARLFSKPYSKEMLKLSFKVVNSNVFDRLDRKCFLDNELKDETTRFDADKGILYVRGEPIKIKSKMKDSNHYKILKHIFVTNCDNLAEDFFYSEIASDEFGDLEYHENQHSWKKYYDACGKVRDKIRSGTKNKVDDFLVFSSGQAGKISINPIYLEA